jgi:predicted nucleic acid-binding protein
MEIKAGELLFLDTNILRTATNEARQHYQLARDLIMAHHSSGLHLCISAQIVREYMVVATRPLQVNGLGLSPNDTIHNIDEFRNRFLFFPETEEVSNELRVLIIKYRLSGARTHDANVVATMSAHGVSKLVTDNTGDFSAFSTIQTFDLPTIHRILRSSA